MSDFDEEKQNKQLDELRKQEEEELVATLAEAKYHLPYIDLYRLGGLDGEDPGLLDDYLTPDAVSFVEWPEIGAGEIGPVVLRVRLSQAGDDRRDLGVEWCR